MIKDQVISNPHELRKAYKEWTLRWSQVEDSPIHECFNGTLLTELKCPKCDRASYTFSRFYELNLGIEDGNSGYGYGYEEETSE